MADTAAAINNLMLLRAATIAALFSLLFGTSFGAMVSMHAFAAETRPGRAGILAGQIASVQMGNGGNPEWLQTGIWVLRGLPAANSTTGGEQDVSFVSRMTMVTPNGTVFHTHRIYDFQATGFKADGDLLLINGTATVTMREGPVPAVPLHIRVSNTAAIAITIEPDKIQSHFGNDPVYGIVSDASRTDGGQEEEEAGQNEETRSSTPLNSAAADTTGVVKKGVSYYGNATGYLAYPENANGTLPGVVMIHEWWGLNQNIKNMAEELASKGYVVLAADLYGGRIATESSMAQQLSGSVRNNPGVAIENLNAAVDYLASLKNVDSSKIASLGWCFGGGQSLQLALNADRPLAATVIYYGNLVTDQQQLSKITWPVLGIFGSADQSIPVSSVKQFEAALDANGTPNEIHIYEGVGHAFANPSGDNYAPKETQDAWQKTLAFLDRHL